MSISEYYSNDLSTAKDLLQKLGDTFKDFESHSLSILTLSDQWRNLQTSFVGVHNSLENRVKKVESKEREIEATKTSLQLMELRYKEVESKERFVEERVKEVDIKEKQVKEWYEGLEFEIEERSKAVELKEKQFSETEFEKLSAVKVKEGEVSEREARCKVREKEVEKSVNGMELKEKELSEKSKVLESKEGVLDERFLVLERREKAVEENANGVKLKEKGLREFSKELKSKEEKLVSKEKEMDELYNAIMVREKESRFGMENVNELLKGIELKEREIDERYKVLEADKKEHQEGMKHMGLKEREIAERCEELEAKKKQSEEDVKIMGLKAKVLSVRFGRVETKEKDVELKEKRVDDQQHSLESKETEINELREKVNERYKALELKEKQVDERCKDAILKEKDIDKRYQAMEAKEKEYEEGVKQMGLKEREIAERFEVLEAKEKKYEEDVKIMGLKEELSVRLGRAGTREKDVEQKFQALGAEEKQINDKTNALDLREKKLNEKYEMVELKEKQVDDLKKMLEAKDKEYEESKEEFNVRWESVETREKDVQEKFLALGVEEKIINEKTKALDSEEKRISEKTKALYMEEKRISDKTKALDLEEKRINEKTKALDLKEKRIDEKTKALVWEERTICLRIGELEAKEKKYEEDVKIMGSKEELSVCLGRVETREKDVEQKFLALGLEEKNIDERRKALELKEKQIDERCKDALLKEKDIEKRYQAMETKEKGMNYGCRMLKLNEKQIEEHSLGIEMREMEVTELLKTVDLKEKQVEKDRKALELKETEIEECSKAIEIKRKELIELCKIVELMKKRAMELKETQNDVKASEFTEEQVNEKQICEPCTVEEVTKKQIDGCDMLAHGESSKLRDSQVVDSNLTQLSQDIPQSDNPQQSCVVSLSAKLHGEIQLLCRNMNPDGVISFLIEHVKVQKLINKGLLGALRSAPHPAKLVLGVSQKFYQNFPCSKQTNACKNSCIFLLEQLVKLSPSISLEVKDEAMVFAANWKLRLKGADVLMNTYGYLQFVAAFKLASLYDANELLSMFEIFYCEKEVYRPGGNPWLCRALGLFEKIPGRIKFLIGRENWLVALKYVLVFKLESNFPPGALLEAYLRLLRREVNDIQKDGSLASKIQASHFELQRLKQVVEFVNSLNLGHRFPVDSLVSQIQKLSSFGENGETFADTLMKKRDASSCTDQQEKRPQMGPDHHIPRVASRDGTTFPQPLQHPAIHMTPNLQPNLQQGNISALIGPSYNAVKPQLFPGQFVLPGNHIFGGPMPVYYGVKIMGLKERENVERCEVLEVKKNEYEECVKKTGLKEREIVEGFEVLEAKEKKMGLKEKEIHEPHKDLELKEKQMDERCKDAILKEKDIDKRFQAMEMKEKHVNIEKGHGALELKEAQIEECSKVIEKKEKEVMELCEAVELNIKEVDKGNEALKLKETQIDECCKLLEPEEKVLIEKSQALETKEKLIANDRKELDLTKKQVNEMQTGDLCQVEEFNEKQKEGCSILVPCELNKLGKAQDVDSSLTDTSQDIPQSDIPQSASSEIHLLCRNMDPDGLRSYLIEHVKDLKLIDEELLDALRSAPDPAKLVLDVSQKFHLNFPCSNQTNACENSCIFLLEQLLKLSPPIALNVKEEAKVFATFWKDRLKGADVVRDTYGFLQFIAAFKLASSYDEDELLSLFDYFYRQNEVYRPDDNPYLCHALGLSKKIPGMIEFHIRSQNWILALRYVCVFKLESKFPPVPLLEAHLALLLRRVHDRLKDGTLTSKIQASYLESKSLEVVVKCVTSLKLQEKFPVDSLVSRIQQLEEFRENNKTSVSTLRSKRDASSFTSVGSLVQQDKRPRVGPDQNTPHFNSQVDTAFHQSLPHHAVHITSILQPNFQQGNISASNGPIYNTLNPQLFSGQFVLAGNHPYGAPIPVYYCKTLFNGAGPV